MTAPEGGLKVKKPFWCGASRNREAGDTWTFREQMSSGLFAVQH
jgi:hypothetical protein